MAVVALGSVLALGGSACSSDTNASSSPTTPVAPGDGVPPPAYSAMPVPDGQIDAAVAALPGLVETAMRDTGVPGIAVAVVHGGETVLAQGYGVADVNTGAQVDSDTAFQLASLSKSVGSTVIAEEVGKGTISWDDPIVEHLPGFALADPYVTANVSYADMYSHRSGLPSHVGDTLEDLGFDQATILERLRFAPLAAFRTENQYTNFGITAAAEAAAAAAGTSWDELSASTLYEPLGMDATTSSYAELQTMPNRAALHVEVDGTWQQLNTRDADAQSPAGGVSSSAKDMATWMAMVLADGEHDGQPLVDADALAEALTPHSDRGTPGSRASRFSPDGLGFNLGVNSTGRVTFSHSGAFAMGAGTTFTLVPSEDLGIVVLTNGSPTGTAEAIAADFLDLALVGSQTQDWPALFAQAFEGVVANPATLDEPAPTDPAPAQPDAAYVGTYANDYYGSADVVAEGGGIVLKLGPAATAYPLTHWDGDSFTWVAPGENSPGPSLVTFSTDAGGGSATMEVVALNEVPPLGVFTR